MALSVTQLEARLWAIKNERKSGSLDERQYYEALLQLLAQMVTSLLEEADHTETMRIEDVRKQIPLILVFVEEQIGRYRQREGTRQ